MYVKMLDNLWETRTTNMLINAKLFRFRITLLVYQFDWNCNIKINAGSKLNGNWECMYNCVGWVPAYLIVDATLYAREFCFAQQQLIYNIILPWHVNKCVMREWEMTLMKFDSITLIKFQWTWVKMSVNPHFNCIACNFFCPYPISYSHSTFLHDSLETIKTSWLKWK